MLRKRRTAFAAGGRDVKGTFVSTCVAAALWTSVAFAAGDFPMASCAGWNGTVTEREGIDTARASMAGIVTKADLQEYCERDPGGETRANGGRSTKARCVNRLLPETRTAKSTSRADCRTGRISYSYGGREPVVARFPLARDADTSCASGMPPVIEQFRMLCPAAAKRFGLGG